MKTKQITPTQYAELRGCTLTNVTNHIRANDLRLLPHVISIKNWGRFYTIEVPSNISKRLFNKYPKLNKGK